MSEKINFILYMYSINANFNLFGTMNYTANIWNCFTTNLWNLNRIQSTMHVLLAPILFQRGTLSHHISHLLGNLLYFNAVNWIIITPNRFWKKYSLLKEGISPSLPFLIRCIIPTLKISRYKRTHSLKLVKNIVKKSNFLKMIITYLFWLYSRISKL